MTPQEAAQIIARIDATWPTRQERQPAELDEWLRFLRMFDFHVSQRAIDELREQLGWRPAMADFRSAYQYAKLVPEETKPALPKGKPADDAPTFNDLYGLAQGDWVYCWRCDMAISLEERATTAGYDEERGLFHQNCPRPGSAPLIPRGQQLERDEYFSKHRLSTSR